MAEDQNLPADEQENNTKQRKRPGKKPLIILGIVVVVMVIVALVWWFLTRNEETTDDAFTDGDVVTIAPKTAGYVTELRVRDNQRVKKGDLLVVIDPRDTTAQRDQAQAQLGLAIAQLHQAQAQLALSKVQYPAQRDEAKAQVIKAQADLPMRRRSIAASEALTRERPPSKVLIPPMPSCAVPRRAWQVRRRSLKWRSRYSCRSASRKPMWKRVSARSIRPKRSWKPRR